MGSLGNLINKVHTVAKQYSTVRVKKKKKKTDTHTCMHICCKHRQCTVVDKQTYRQQT